MAKKGSPLHSIEDLVGKKVAFTAPGSVTNMLILMSMKKKAIDPNAMKLVPVGGIGANVSAVLNNAVDAGMCGEPVWSENEDKLQPVFWPKDILSPNMMQTVAVTTAEYATEGVAKLRGIIAGRFIDLVSTGWARDRDSRIASDPGFGAITARLWAALRPESIKAMGRTAS
jgi:NitT/TauT family transport system substrate-binding protein